MVSSGKMPEEDVYTEELACLPPCCVAPRRRDFAFGRLAARSAARSIGYGLPPLLPDARGAPVWPDDLTGSISHSAGIALAVVAPKGLTAGIGVDIETIGSDGVNEIPHLIADAEELRSIGTTDLQLLRIFSAKEAVFKALYPLVGRFFDFDCVRLIPTDKGFTATLREELGTCPEGSQCEVFSDPTSGMVLSITCLPHDWPRMEISETGHEPRAAMS